MNDILKDIPTYPERQDSLSAQLIDLFCVANKLGLIDAADAMRQTFGASMEKTEDIKYGCHCDLDEGMEPDGCVIDDGERHLCVYATKIARKEQCAYWKIIAKG